jgi:WD40 repeat protein
MSCKLLNKREYLVGFESGKVIKFSTESDTILASRQVAKPGIPIMTMCAGGENNSLIIAGSAENLLYKLDDQLNICSEIELTNSGLNDVCICDDGTCIVVTLGWDKRIRVFDAGEKNSDDFCKLAVINCDEYLHSSNLQAAVFLKEKRMLITGSLDGRISGWKNFTGKFIK